MTSLILTIAVPIKAVINNSNQFLKNLNLI